MHPRIVIAIARKDLVDALKNMYLLFAIILPIAMSLLFRVIFPSDTGSGSGGMLDIVIYDPGKSQLVQYLMDSKQASLFFVGSAAEVRAQVDKDKLGGLVIPANFDSDIKAGKMPDLRVYYSSRHGASRQSPALQLVQSGLRSVAGQAMPANIIMEDTAGTAAGAATTSSSFNLTSYYLLLFLVMSLTMVGVFIVPYILVEEKEKATLKAILVSPATYTDVVLGKGIVGLFYALLVAAILLVMNNGLTGNILLTVSAIVLGSTFLVLVGLLMGAAFKQLTQVNSWSSIVMLVLMMPGMFGDIMPPPEPVATVMKLIPTHYLALSVTQGMNNTATMAGSLINLGVLAGMSIISFAAVIWFLKRERL